MDARCRFSARRFLPSRQAHLPSTDRVQVPGDYVIGPDDELQIRIWGQINADLRVVVDRSGQIYIPRVGEISVAGVHYSDLEQHLKNEILKVFHNFTLTVSIGRIRSIQVFVVGQARYPGTYTISSLSTLVNAIFASGGPTPQGSLRDVQVQRDGKTIAHLDFYELLVKGDKSKDVRLQSGDVMYYPPVGPLVAMAGSVNTPAIYEVKHDSSLADAIEIAGGLSTVADSNKITVERIGDHDIAYGDGVPAGRAIARDAAEGWRYRARVIDCSALQQHGYVARQCRQPGTLPVEARDEGAGSDPECPGVADAPLLAGPRQHDRGRSTEYPIRAVPTAAKTDNSTSPASPNTPPDANASSNVPTENNQQAPAADQSQGNGFPSSLDRKSRTAKPLPRICIGPLRKLTGAMRLFSG